MNAKGLFGLTWLTSTDSGKGETLAVGSGNLICFAWQRWSWCGMIKEPWGCAFVFVRFSTRWLPKSIPRLAEAQFIYFGDGSWKSVVLLLISHCVEGELASFFVVVKSQLVNTLDFVDHMVSVAAIQFCSCNVKAAIGNKWMSVIVPIKLYV